jgi:hypothetical protein
MKREWTFLFKILKMTNIHTNRFNCLLDLCILIQKLSLLILKSLEFLVCEVLSYNPLENFELFYDTMRKI